MASSPEAPRARRPSFKERGASCLAWQLRLLSALQLLAGAGFIAMAVFLQWPPGDPLTL